MSSDRYEDKTQPGGPVRGSAPASAPTANLFKQRRAVAALKERWRVRLVSSTYSGGALQSARVIVGDKFYDVRPSELAFLRAGRTPSDLGLEPVEDPGGD